MGLRQRELASLGELQRQRDGSQSLIGYGLLVACCALGTSHRVADWQSNRTLWTATGINHPLSPSVLFMQGVFAWSDGKTPLARQRLQQAGRALSMPSRPNQLNRPLHRLIEFWAEVVGP